MSQQLSRRRPILALFLVAALLGQTGCASLAEIRDFAALAKEASESFPPMMADFKDSFIRQRQTQNLQLGRSLDDAIKQARADCDASDICKNVPDFIGASRVLENYMKVMGQLAADGLPSYDANVKAFADQLQASAKIKDTERDAIKSLATLLFNAVANGYRQKKLAETLTQHNQDIQVLTGALSLFVDDYESQLRAEADAKRSYYESVIAEHRKEEPLSRVLVYDLYERDRQELENKRNAAETYKKFLQTVQKAHAQLASESSKLGAADVQRLAATYGAAIQSQIEILRKAFAF